MTKTETNEFEYVLPSQRGYMKATWGGGPYIKLHVTDNPEQPSWRPSTATINVWDYERDAPTIEVNQEAFEAKVDEWLLCADDQEVTLPLGQGKDHALKQWIREIREFAQQGKPVEDLVHIPEDVLDAVSSSIFLLGSAEDIPDDQITMGEAIYTIARLL